MTDRITITINDTPQGRMLIRAITISEQDSISIGEAMDFVQQEENGMDSATVTYREAITVARDLTSEDGENGEYDRALCELIGDLWGKRYVELGDRKMEVARDLGINL